MAGPHAGGLALIAAVVAEFAWVLPAMDRARFRLLEAQYRLNIPRRSRRYTPHLTGIAIFGLTVHRLAVAPSLARERRTAG